MREVVLCVRTRAHGGSVVRNGLVHAAMQQTTLDHPHNTTETYDELDGLDELVASGRIPGIAVLAAKNGEIQILDIAGMRDTETGDPLKTDDLFHLGSCTKAMTATLAASIIEDGLLSWDTTLAKALPVWLMS